MEPMLLFWPLLGALIGAYAAQKRGFPTVTCVIAGLLLGPLAFLLFFVSGVVSANEQQRKCPYCAEWIRPEATVCKHCHKEIPRKCPYCAGWISPAATVCQHCDKDVPPPLAMAVPPQHGMSPILKVALVVLALFFALIAAVVMFAK